MKRWLIILMCVVGASCVWASEYASVVVPSSCIKKSENVILYNQNIEEIFAHDIVKTVAGVKGFNAPSLNLLKKTLTTNSQLTSVYEPEEKIKILSKVFGANKIIYITVNYEIKSMDNKGAYINKLNLISENNAIRLTTKVEILDNSGNDIIWSNIYYKNINFDSVNNKDISAITRYYERLSNIVFEEMKTRSTIRRVNGITPQDVGESHVEMKNETIDNNHIITPVAPIQPVNSKITPQLQLQENLGDKPKLEKPAKYVEKSPEPVVKQEPAKKVEVKEKVKVTKPQPSKSAEPKAKKPQPVKQEKVKQEKIKQEKVKEEKSSGKELKIWQRIKENLQIDLKSSTPEKEINVNNVKCSPVEVLPTYTDIHVKPRRNSKDYVPQFNNSVNDI